MNDKIRVVLIDDHPLFREGVAYTLDAQPDIEVVGQGESLSDAVRLAHQLQPDVILLDVNIPGGGTRAAQEVANSSLGARIVMLTASGDQDDLAAAMQAGAQGYILKGVAARELVSIVRSVKSGEGYVTPALAASLLSGLTNRARREPAAFNPLDDLTERERQILEHVSGGLSNKEVAAQLHLSEKTIKHYMTSIMEKLGVRNRVEAALLAKR